jgi:DNA polymerase-3 subunit delta
VKLAGRDAARFLARPDPGTAGALIYGADAARVGMKRRDLLAALVGPDAAADMRLTRFAAADVRRDPAALVDALKAIGFFPGPRAVTVEEATEAQAEPILAALRAWTPGDAALVVTAGALKASSALRKGFEAAKAAVAIPVYDDPPDRAEIEAALTKAGVAQVDREAFADVEALARSLESGEFHQAIERLALYKRGDATPVSGADVAAIAPAPPEAEADALLDLAAEGRADALALAMRRLGGGSSAATGLVIAAGRHFRTLYAASVAADGPDAALARARPPVWGPRRTRMAAQARRLGPDHLERALGWIMDADLALRSSRPPPGHALAERLLVRIAMLRRD